jgi:hypothetical protein
MLFLDSFTMKVYDWKEDYLGIINDFENIVENGALAHYFSQCFQQSSAWEASKGVYME